MLELPPVDVVLLKMVTGAGFWNGVDNAISHVNAGWKNQPCASRGSWVGLETGTALSIAGGLVSAGVAARNPGKAAKAFLVGTAVGAVNGHIGTFIYSSYVNNCEAQKAQAAKK